MAEERTQDMGSHHEHLFEVLPRIPVPAYLCERVQATVSRTRARILYARLVLSSLFGVSSLIGLAIAGRALAAALGNSGFATYASLIFSDEGIVLSYGRTFLLSLLESLPTTEVAIIFALAAVLIQSLRVLIVSAIDWKSPARPASFHAASR